ncbi:hypothetical protein DCS32_06620 [Dokdonia sp. Dokd-P16]|uniref:outer membrane beta-barrel protein n=1 Tax=Dokdonia sp. Dokd-P16 TaxID=2173169 RepID=UPI000D545BEC|nr:outer membrane beta-barrel protein [Dokdonia sp. Dokd-P16]AWH73837.1 hypothetical protein DCS32_06620 [Dokdonia sp. Dokd-P16]
MKEKKNIDRLFQEKFKDFESHPSDHVWNNILAAQKEKEDKKVIPLWWKLGGIAAALLLLFGLGSLFINSSSQNNIQIVDTPIINDENVVLEENTATTSITPQVSKNNEEGNKFVTADESQITSSIKNNTTSRNPKSANPASRRDDNNSRNGSQNSPNKAKLATSEKNAGAIAYQANSPQLNTGNTNSQLHLNKAKVKNNVSPQEDNNTVAQVTTLEEENNPNKNLIDEAQKIETLQEDKLAQVDNNTKMKRWDVGAVAAPVYYGDFGGSGLDKQFADNDKSGDVNLSYGVQVSYAISPKFKIRTGVSNVDLSYNTNEISFSTNGLGRSVRGISFTDNAKVLAILDNPATQHSFTADNAISRIGVSSNGSLQQQLSYVEVPLEAIYVISDKRVGLSLIGGVSTLFLNENDVVLKSSQLTTSLGTANGVNEVSFTTNLGVGLDYKFTKKIIFNIEPSLKYQLNSFDNKVVDFQPYYIGVYTGVSYKF